MKTICLYALIFVSLFSCKLVSGFPGAIDQFIPAFSKGNAQVIGASFDGTVELSIKGKTGSYSASQATSILNEFFTSNPPSAFEIEHNGSSSGSEFAIGKLSTQGGTFKVSIFVKNNGGSIMIKELRIE
jgi:hypothetical protein